MIKLKHFLLEDRQSKLSYLKNNMKLSDEIIKIIADSDVPEKYILWVGKIAKNYGIRFEEDLPQIINALRIYDVNKSKISKKDINQIKSRDELYKIVEPFEGKVTSNREELEKVKKEIEVIYEDSEWKVLIPHTKEASIAYGKGTKWCTSALHNNMFDTYNKMGPLYIAINKKNPRRNIQWHYGGKIDRYDYTFQLMDINDNEVSYSNISPIIQRIIIKYITPENIIYDVVKYVSIDNIIKYRDDKELIKAYVMMPKFSYDIPYKIIDKYLSVSDKEQLVSNKEGTLNPDGSANFKDLIFTHYSIDSMDDFSFVINKVENDFNIDSNYLTTLKGCPTDVGGYFSCASNRLITLQGSPLKINDFFRCNRNNLKSLVGGPQIVNKSFYCSENNLETLEGAPKQVGGGFDCSSNRLTSLKGAPNEVGEEFNCRFNNLTSLEYCPETVGWFFDCSRNELTSLKGAPKKVGGDFDCSNNELTSLNGAPKHIVINFYCRNNKLTSLEGGPLTVAWDYNCIFNKLTSLKGAPKKVGGNFDCSRNELTTLEGAPEEVELDFDCSFNYLNSLEGCPKIVNGNFICKHQKSDKKFTEEEIRAVCDVKGKVMI